MSEPDTSHGHGGPLRALKHYNFRAFWFGQLFSLIGSWMQGLAQSWLIILLADPAAAQHVLHSGGDTASAVQHTSAAVQATANRYSGLVNFFNGLPILVLTLFAGVIIDRVNKRKLLIVTQIGMSLCALTLGLLIRSGQVTISDVMIVALVLGTFMAFDMPTRQSFVVEMVGKADLPSAVALNSSMFNAARAVGPAVAGLLLSAHVSLATCFIGNAASYILVIIGILLMRGKNIGAPLARATDAPQTRLWENLKEGLVYVWGNHTTRNIILLVGVLGTFAFSFNVLIPTYVRYSLLPHASSGYQVKAFGFLETVRGIGALIAAISVAFLTRPDRYKYLLIGGSLLSNILLMVFAFERNVILAYVTMAVVTYGFVLIFASANTVMQMTIPDALRGRVMSIYMLVFVGTGPVGSLFAGYLAQFIGAPWTIFLFALITVIIVAVLSFRKRGLLTIDVPATSARRVPLAPVAQKKAVDAA